MLDSILKLAIFFLVGAGMAAVPIILSFVLWHKRKGAQNPIRQPADKIQSFTKEYEPYESGMPPVGSGRAIGFEYLIYAILFLLFDVVAILAFLGVLAIRQNKFGFAQPLLALLGLALLVIAYGVKKRDYLKI